MRELLDRGWALAVQESAECNDADCGCAFFHGLCAACAITILAVLIPWTVWAFVTSGAHLW